MKEQFSNFLHQIVNIGGEIRPLIFHPPATFDEIHEIEEKLNFKIPHDFKTTLLTLSSHFEFKWFLPDNFKLPVELKGIFAENSTGQRI